MTCKNEWEQRSNCQTASTWWWTSLIPKRAQHKFEATQTFSPISIWSPPGRILRSGFRAHASNILSYCECLNFFPNRIFSLRVAFWIQASWGTYASDPCKTESEIVHRRDKKQSQESPLFYGVRAYPEWLPSSNREQDMTMSQGGHSLMLAVTLPVSEGVKDTAMSQGRQGLLAVIVSGGGAWPYMYPRQGTAWCNHPTPTPMYRHRHTDNDWIEAADCW